MTKDHDKLKERLKYYDKLLDAEKPRTFIGDGVPNGSLTSEVIMEEIGVVLRRMNRGTST